MDRHDKLFKIADRIDEISFAANKIAVVNAEDKSICIAKTGSGLKAFFPLLSTCRWRPF